MPAGVNIAGAVNFAHQGDPVVENAMLAALGRASELTGRRFVRWRTVNSQFAKDIPYLWLDVTGERVGGAQQRAELGLRHGG